MGGIGKVISGAVGGIVKTVESSIGSAVMNVAKSVAPAVTDMLENVAHGAIGGLGNALSGIAGNIPLVGGLLQNLIGKGVQGLNGLADGGISGLVNGLVGSLGNMLNVGGQNVTTPSLGDRAATAPQSTAQLQQVLQQVLAQMQGAQGAQGGAGGLTAPNMPPPGASPADMLKYQQQLMQYQNALQGAGTTTSTGAATGTGGASAPSVGGVAPKNSSEAASQVIAAAGGLTMPKTPGPGASQQDLMNFEKSMSDYTNEMQLLSNVLRMLEDTNKAIIGNIR